MKLPKNKVQSSKFKVQSASWWTKLKVVNSPFYSIFNFSLLTFNSRRPSVGRSRLSVGEGRRRAGFTLIELLVVIAVLGILSTIVVVAIDPAKLIGGAKDAKRIGDIAQIVSLLEQYKVIYGNYPEETAPFGAGGWETSDASSDTSQFMEYLVNKNVAKIVPIDPINKRITGFSFFSSVGSYFYAFYHYTAAHAVYYGCDFNTDFVVIAFREAEGTDRSKLSRATCGDLSGGCPHGGIPYTCRDWGTEFEHSILLN